MTRRIIQTKRDRKIMDFLEKGFYATSEMIDRLFFNSPVACRRRLVRMTEVGWIERVRADESTPYVYFIPQRHQEKSRKKNAKHEGPSYETEQGKQLYLTQCLAEMTQLGDLVFYAKQYTLTSSLADLIAVVDMNGTRMLVVADVINRDGNGARHENFFNSSVALKSLVEKYGVKRTIHIVYAERIINNNESTFFIQKKIGMSYQDYKEIDWSRTTYHIRDLISSASQ